MYKCYAADYHRYLHLDVLDAVRTVSFHTDRAIDWPFLHQHILPKHYPTADAHHL